MWSWVLHRITGATIFFFLFVHVLDTALVRVSPQTYNEVVATYKTPIVGLMEFGLVAAVLFHALNGIRVILIDFWAEGPRHQKTDVVGHRRRSTCWSWCRRRWPSAFTCGSTSDEQPRPSARPRPEAPVIQRSHDRPASLDNPRSPRRRAGIPNFEKFAWLFMRFSGVALVFLAIGHLFIMLMWENGVYRIDFNYRRAALGFAVLAILGFGPAVAGAIARR